MTDISEYLTKHDATLEQSFKQAKFDLRSLKQEIVDLKVDFESTFAAFSGFERFQAGFDDIGRKLT